MTKRSPEEVLAVLRQAGFTPDQAITMAAISGAESGWDDANVGDVALQDQTWGPSFGLFQVRTLKDATNSGGIRDLAALSGDDLAQAKAAYAISKGGTDFSAWTDFRNGKWRDFLSPVQRVAGALANIPGKVAGQIIGKVAGAGGRRRPRPGHHRPDPGGRRRPGCGRRGQVGVAETGPGAAAGGQAATRWPALRRP
jgi:hypothetical protein